MQTNQLIHWSCVIRGQKTSSGYKKLWDDKWIEDFASKLNAEYKIKDFVIGDEIGDELGAPHLQMYIRMAKKTRIAPLLQMLVDYSGLPVEKVQLQPAASPAALAEYCQKQGAVTKKKDFLNPHFKNLKEGKLNKFQQKIYDQLQQIRDRQLLVVSDGVGGLGKTWLCKWLHATSTANVIVFPTSGTLNSSLYAISKSFEQFNRAQNGSDEVLILVNIARTDVRIQKDNIASFMCSMEAIKDGFWSSSWLGKIQTVNYPSDKIKILIVSNLSPTYFHEYLSHDRLVVITED
jgi:hypothetical protein